MGLAVDMVRTCQGHDDDRHHDCFEDYADHSSPCHSRHMPKIVMKLMTGSQAMRNRNGTRNTRKYHHTTVWTTRTHAHAPDHTHTHTYTHIHTHIHTHPVQYNTPAYHQACRSSHHTFHEGLGPAYHSQASCHTAHAGHWVCGADECPDHRVHDHHGHLQLRTHIHRHMG